MMHRLGTGLLVAALVLGGCVDKNFYDEPEVAAGSAGGAKGVATLSAAETRAFLGGSTLVHEAENRRWVVYLRTDGTMAGVARPIGARDILQSANGVWEVTEDGTFCREWTGPWVEGDSGCATVRRDRDDYVFDPVGEQGATLRRTRLAGNPLSL